MRPTRLELRGFTAFRESTSVDFADADLFALAGPTGAGKSSLIDAMCFALYGSVPRLDRRAVAPVVSASSNEARVRLDFTVGDEAYTAVRVVRRTATGATTKEARLEAHPDGRILAGDADGVTTAAERLLGLEFEQFTTCIVLPQGDFARFLHDTPKGRQDLLVRLLELDVYDRMRARARERAAAAGAKAETAEGRLADMADVTEDAVAGAAATVSALQTLHDLASRLGPRLVELARDEAAAREQRAVLARRRELLDGLHLPGDVHGRPEDVGQVDDHVAAAEQELAAAVGHRGRAVEALERAEQLRAGLGEMSELLAWSQDHERRSELCGRRERGTAVVEERRRAVREADDVLAAAAADRDAAQAELEGVRRQHAAHTLRRELTAGDDCPVCGQTVGVLPSDVPGTLRAAEKRLHAATDAERRRRAQHAEAVASFGAAAQLLEQITADLDALDARLVESPGAAQVAAQLEAIRRADAALGEARTRERAAHAAVEAATGARERARELREDAWRSLDRARDRVAELAPPSLVRDSLRSDRDRLQHWSRDVAERLTGQLGEAVARADEIARQRHAVEGQLSAAARAAGVPVTDADVPTAAHEALVLARRRHDELREKLALAGRLRADASSRREAEQVATSLARHLAANGFERWLLDEALGRLAIDASGRLRELSAGRYSLAVDSQRNFAVVDHLAADERRSARTLSGGETFLASLALALALADEIAGLAAAGTVRLESIFLDEGFGTLDPAALDVVATAIEELGATGRTVGVVTHVRELADRMPVRFEVRRSPAGAEVERVER